MCTVFGLQMENYQGDLNDIVRASGGPMGCASAQASDTVPASSWRQFPSDPLNFSSSSMDDHSVIAFGDPFSAVRDPLFHELDVAAGSSTYYSSHNSTDQMINNTGSTTVEDTSNFSGASNIVGFGHHSKIFEDDMRSPCNILSRIQISPSSSKLPVSPCDSPVMGSGVYPRGIKVPAVLPSEMIDASSSKSCLIDNTGPLQISSPRNLGMKRRKSQAKKVVCIPSPAATNSRSSGEVVPSDLWAWRKYGQKPIKGSPYPRGYYRCSSSKGCSARKQVERSRTDPNMLVITYTSEHNHPWPTQRNALAGSTRSQPSKNNASASKISSPCSQPQNTVNPKEELKESSNDALSPAVAASSTASAPVKEEIEDIEKQLDTDDSEFGEGNPQTYRPALPDSSQQSEDFFADLDELEADPLNLLFPQGFSTDQDERKEKKAMDPFSMFDWSGDDGASF
ncbi:probable WRKY transcription factor 14 isoform X2 [Durio zibethinus]|uniref:Probable WRKY transcription factor 14 isoform X2 n=1 Tax=Durio zibethinus TaxID=66656 RepID=A0A6P5X6V8_DURZI|nr:probable WRKY transcription factor 14 isoform X2 [Durio zibethinus]